MYKKIQNTEKIKPDINNTLKCGGKKYSSTKIILFVKQHKSVVPAKSNSEKKPFCLQKASHHEITHAKK